MWQLAEQFLRRRVYDVLLAAVASLDEFSIDVEGEILVHACLLKEMDGAAKGARRGWSKNESASLTLWTEVRTGRLAGDYRPAATVMCTAAGMVPSQGLD
ncbi:hypothetical protein HpMS107_05170 [Helicobacter pylori]